jgi:hypothetical protein
VARLLEIQLDQLRDIGVVFDDQDATHRRSV